MPDDHQPWTQWLIAYHDGELTPAKRDLLQSHLSACPRCRHALSELNRLREVLRSAPVPWASLRSSREVWRQMREQLPHRRETTHSLPHWLRWLPSAGLLLCNVTAQVVGTIVLLISLLAALGLIDPRWMPYRTSSVQADQVLSWLALRGLSEPLGWGANLIALPPEWGAVTEFVLSALILSLLIGILSLGYLLSLWLLWRHHRSARGGQRRSSLRRHARPPRRPAIIT
ncbi:MAG: hypothetical protein GXP39_03595 [Chloroflexi bacterium]|nr:hypothetical protein [Chloroflexota bacterium]